MKVTLLGNTKLDDCFFWELFETLDDEQLDVLQGETGGSVIALAAIRQCYSTKTAIEVIKTESKKYFGENGKEKDRLFKQIVNSGHTSTLEHISFTFAIEGVSRALLAQLTRHRVGWGFSVQSQRYNKFSTDSRSKGFDYVTPEKIETNTNVIEINDETFTAKEYFEKCMNDIQNMYDNLIGLGVPQEDTRAVLPNAACTNLVVSCNLRALLDFCEKRKSGNGAQKEITILAQKLKDLAVGVEPWTESFFK